VLNKSFRKDHLEFLGFERSLRAGVQGRQGQLVQVGLEVIKMGRKIIGFPRCESHVFSPLKNIGIKLKRIKR
jgi:hypothetical protein